MRPIYIRIRCSSNYPSAVTTSFGHTFAQRRFQVQKPLLPNLFHQLSHRILLHKIHRKCKRTLSPHKDHVNLIQYTLHHDDLRSDVQGVDSSRKVLEAAEAVLHGGTVEKDVSVGREFNATVSEGHTVGLGAEED